ncbi:hypothetical protein FDP25_07840 [Roseovarius sp. A21]|uniref:Uncharacterized protein n=1 Tax=Roseovarius bejariae TaxID=2576383 RepID=A0A844CW00_9RHOB|nr:hypothetical protein [Roseovarius bejariae]MRU15336.1 hypothetical protein [Roseovarius bejariae]
MSERFEIKAHEHGIVRLFTLDTDADGPAMSTEPDWGADTDDPPWPLRDALGVTYLDSDFIELFDVADLEGVGLPQYMIDGLGVSEADVEEDRARLEAISGKILVVVSSAFGGFAGTLTPKSPLRWIGTYTEDRAPVSFKPLPSEGAKGATGDKAPPSDAAMSGRVASIALLVLFALVAVVVWVAS